MRKFIIALLLITFQSAPAFAAEYSDANYCSDQASNHADGAQAGCNAAAGCQWNSNTSKCVPCAAETYKEAGNTTCLSCGTTGTNTSWDHTQSGTRSQNDCKYTATCQATQYFGGYSTGCVACSTKNNALTGTYQYSTKTGQTTHSGTVGTSTSNASSVCATCGTNSTTDNNGLGCTCNTGYHVNGKTNTYTDNDNIDCVINTYTITYKPNGGNGSDKTQTVEHKESITLKDNTTFTRTGYTLEKWQVENTSTAYDTGATITDGFTSDITLLAQWSGKGFTITYNAGDAGATCAPTQQTCTYGTTCNAKNIPSGCTYAGYLFENWTYNNQPLSPGTNLANVSNGNNMELTAVWTKCPKGHYCTSVTKSANNPDKCPAGSTSAEGSTAITHCYMTKETKICAPDAQGNTKCFTLPIGDNDAIKYHNGQ